MSTVLDAGPIPSGRVEESEARVRPLSAAHEKGRQDVIDGTDRVANLNDHNVGSTRLGEFRSLGR